ncbi:MAG: hemolysin family protein [Scrofimicrobium sp.]
MSGLANPGLSVVLAILGVLLVFFSSWVTAVDIAISRMSLAYAEDLEEEGKKGAPSLASALKTRREASLALLVPRDTSLALGILFITVPLIVQFAEHRLPWWLNLLLTVAIIGLVILLSLLGTAALLSGERYVWVALRGAPLANQLLRRPSRIAALSRGEERSQRRLEQRSTRLAVVEELRELVDEVTEGDPSDLDEEDREIIRSVFELGQTRVGEVMVPRGEIVSIHSDESADDAIELFIRSGFSRIPVIGKNRDDVQGVLYFKDVVRRLHEADGSDHFQASDIMRPASFVPEMKLADDELRVMQDENSHLALVVDEYGGIAGLVTAEDIIEELVGELQDEHDHSAAAPEQVAENVWEVPSSYSLDDLADLIDVKVDDDDVYSVGGLLAKTIGKVPLPGSTAQVGPLLIEAGDEVGRRRQVRTVTVTVASPGSDPKLDTEGSETDGEAHD